MNANEASDVRGPEAAYVSRSVRNNEDSPLADSSARGRSKSSAPAAVRVEYDDAGVSSPSRSYISPNRAEIEAADHPAVSVREEAVREPGVGKMYSEAVDSKYERPRMAS